MLPVRQVGRLLGSFILVAAMSCAVGQNRRNAPSAPLEDGVYPVIQPDREPLADRGPGGEVRVVKVESLPIKGEPPETFLVVADPIVRIRDVSGWQFGIDQKNECSRVALKNTDRLKAYSRDHVGSRLAIVIGGKVITAHKIRVPLESDEIVITFCTEGSGDHLHRNLREVILAPRQ